MASMTAASSPSQPHEQKPSYKSPTDYCRKVFGSLPSISSDSNDTNDEMSTTQNDSVNVNLKVSLFHDNDSQLVWIVDQAPSRCWNRILLAREKDGLYYKLLGVNVDEIKAIKMDGVGFPVKFQAKMYPGQMSDGWQSDYTYDSKIDSFLQTNCHSINLHSGKTERQTFPCSNLDSQ